MARFKKPIPLNMFVVSKGMQYEQNLEHWKAWFASKGIATLVIQDVNERYFLCREGVEAVDSRLQQRLERKTKPTKTETEMLGAVQ